MRFLCSTLYKLMKLTKLPYLTKNMTTDESEFQPDKHSSNLTNLSAILIKWQLWCQADNWNEDIKIEEALFTMCIVQCHFMIYEQF